MQIDIREIRIATNNYKEDSIKNEEKKSKDRKPDDGRNSNNNYKNIRIETKIKQMVIERGSIDEYCDNNNENVANFDKEQQFQ